MSSRRVGWLIALATKGCNVRIDVDGEDPTPEEFGRMLAAGKPVTLNVRCRPTSLILPDSANSANWR
jgi:hypothetical protein